MMGPDYTHWHGTYEVAKRFYAEFIPALEKIIEHNIGSKDKKKSEAAQLLKNKLLEVLESADHKWYINKMDPAEAAKRLEAQKQFQERYK